MSILPKSKKSRLIAALLVLLVLFLMWWTFWVFSIFILHKDQFAKNVYINGEPTNSAKINDYIFAKEQYIKNQPIVIKVSNNTEQTYKASNIGININSQAIKDIAKQSRLKSALIPFSVKQQRNVNYIITDQDLAATAEQLTTNSADKPQNAKFVLKADGTLDITDGVKGNGVNYQDLKSQIYTNVNGWNLPSTLNAKIQPIEPRINKTSLQNLTTEIDQTLKNTYIVNDNSKPISLDKAKIVSFYEPVYQNGKNTLAVNKILATNYLNEVLVNQTVQPKDVVTYVYKSGKPSSTSGAGSNGSKISNNVALSDDFYKALVAKTNFSGQTVREPIVFKTTTQNIDDTLVKRSFTYSVVTWGTVYADFNEFKALVAETLNDSRGWRKANVTFTQVASGGDFTMVLAEPASLPARYPSVCDATYSCQVGRYVMINDTRWRNATSVWTGSLRDYRHMVTNHETGHWLGQPHQYCQVAGQAAPVMQQQSISLQGCAFNPWPLDYEAQKVSNRY